MKIPELNKIYVGDTLSIMRTWPDEFVQCVVTSPPYWGLRDYGVVGQIGLEATPEEFVERMVEVFREVRRVLRKDGTLWLNIGDSYCAAATGKISDHCVGLGGGRETQKEASRRPDKFGPGLKPKDLVGIPWRLAFALQADGWYLRSEIIWHKPNPMPESVRDRPTKSHEQIFLLAKSDRYFYDAEAIKESASYSTHERQARASAEHKSAPTDKRNGIRGRKSSRIPTGWDTGPGTHKGISGRYKNNPSFDVAIAVMPDTRNKRTVWTVTTQPFPEAHFATFPEALVEPCVRAGSRIESVVFDPFMGAGTTALVALKNGRRYIGTELNPEYVQIAEDRINREAGLLKAMAQ